MIDTIFFICSKIFWALARPESLVLLALLVAFLSLLAGRVRRAAWWLGGTLSVLVALSAYPLGDLFLRPLETHYPPAPPLGEVAGIIQLGGSERAELSDHWHVPLLNDRGERYLATLALARRFPEARIVFAGGNGALNGAPASEADVARQIFTENGIPPERLVLEGRSRNTAENAAFARDMIGETATGPWVLVTSAFHMPRAMETFCAAGWHGLVAWPTDFNTGPFKGRTPPRLARNMDELNAAAKEWIGLLVYRLTGRAQPLEDGRCT